MATQCCHLANESDTFQIVPYSTVIDSNVNNNANSVNHESNQGAADQLCDISTNVTCGEIISRSGHVTKSVSFALPSSHAVHAPQRSRNISEGLKTCDKSKQFAKVKFQTCSSAKNSRLTMCIGLLMEKLHSEVR